ncbi:MAG TPA: hypothetical protein VIK26_03155 [Clostridium sp.]
MDTFTPFQTFSFDTFTFIPTKYEEYCDAKLISKGSVNTTIIAKSKKNGEVDIILVENSIEDKIATVFQFDTTISLNDRLQLTILPSETNVEDVTFQLLRHNIKLTRQKKDFTPLEPIVGHIFTDNMNIVKISF